MSEQSYTVYEPEQFRSNRVARADDLVFIKDGFSWWAMLVPVLWMIYHRLWIPLIGFVIAFAVLFLLALLFGASTQSGGFLLFGLSIGFGFLANDIRRMMMDRQAYKLVSAIAGPTRLECERRFFENWQPLQEQMERQTAL